MAVLFQPWLVLSLIFVFHNLVTICNCQPDGPRNIETFYPSAPSDPPPQQPPPPPPVLQPQSPPPPNSSSSNTRSKTAKAVAATAAGAPLLTVIAIFVFRKCFVARRKKEGTISGSPSDRRVVPQPNEFERFDGNLKAFVVDENGLDVVYWRNLEGRKSRGLHKGGVTSSRKKRSKEDVEVENGEEEDGNRIRKGSRKKKREVIQETALLRGMSSSSHLFFSEEDDRVDRITTINHLTRRSGSSARYLKGIQKPDESSSSSPPPTSPSQLTEPLVFSAVSKHQSPTPPPLPPISKRKSPVIPPPPPSKGPAPPPPPPNGHSLNSTAKPPAAPKEMGSDCKLGKPSREGMAGSANDQVKMKPLHWDKINAKADHSMVWDKIEDGSFRFDGDLMEALFGTVAANKTSQQAKSNAHSSSNSNAVQSAKIFILDPRKSQNTAIVLKSLNTSRDEIIDSLKEGEGLSGDTMEKLARISPTEEEESLILDYKGHLSRLADAEEFLYQILKAVPTAFKRLDAMYFRLNFDSELLQLKEALQTLELGCKELRTRGLFMKLLEAILKAGNRMNAGTSRGNAQAFNLTALRKLSDVKSMDGKTTLLYFVVEEVVRSEGKRCAINLNRSLNRNSSNSYLNVDLNLASEEEKDREYIKLGLPIVGGLSAEFSNVKKSADIDYDSFNVTVSALGSRTSQIGDIVIKCDDGGGGRFARETKSFLENAEQQLKMVKEDQAKVMELVKITTDYYQSGSSKNREAHPLQLFGIVKDFLRLVDQTCIEIARNMQKRKTTMASLSHKAPAARAPVNFPNMRGRFMLDNSGSSSSDSNDGS